MKNLNKRTFVETHKNLFTVAEIEIAEIEITEIEITGIEIYTTMLAGIETHSACFVPNEAECI
jgi:hypothetical protein